MLHNHKQICIVLCAAAVSLGAICLPASGLHAQRRAESGKNAENGKNSENSKNSENGDDYARIEALRRANVKITGIRPAADGEHYTLLTCDGLVRRAYDDPSHADELLLRLPFECADYLFSPDGQTVLLSDARSVKRIYRHSYSSDIWLAPLGGTPRKVLADARDASFSPDGQRIAYSRDNNLWLYDIQSGISTALTDDGCRNAIINGTSDWVYEEEFGFTRAYAFSPDGGSIAFLRFDESEVPTAQIDLRSASGGDSTVTFKYPRAGEKNSAVTLHVADTRSGKTERIDTGRGDNYILNVGWTPRGELYFYRINRRQNRFEVVLRHADGRLQTIYDERSPLYVERPDAGTVTFIDGDRFIVREETTAGYMHLYLHSIAHGRLGAITSGAWEVTGLAAADGDEVFYLSTEDSPLRRSLWRVHLDGTGKERLTPAEGFCTVNAGCGMKYFVCTHSTADRPDIVTVHRRDGSVVDTLADNRARVAAAGKRPERHFFTFTTERGDTLNAWMTLPEGFNPAKRYPVLLTQYSGPGSQQAADRWNTDWEDALAAHGYAVVCADGRGTGFRGEKFKKQTYGRLGQLEVEDQLSLARYMASQRWVDDERIGIYGWSYGGFMALGCAFRGDGLFKAAIAVAPVASWRRYDSIYTETYNGLPQDNPSGYDDNSPENFAHLLHDRTRLLIIHGTADDNVHPQNTEAVAEALRRAGKSFEVQLYPHQNHSMMPDCSGDVRRRMIGYILENL